MADDDGAFGDFVFASRHHPHPGISFNFTQKTTPPPPPNANDDNDNEDDWGDFLVPSPPTSSKPNGFSALHPSLSYPSFPTSEAFDPFGFQNHNSTQPPAADPHNNNNNNTITNKNNNNDNTTTTTTTNNNNTITNKNNNNNTTTTTTTTTTNNNNKLLGPLPLSIFGGDEQDHRNGSVDPPNTTTSNVPLHRTTSDTAATVNRFNFNFESGISDIIASLYAHSPPIKSDAGSNSIIFGSQSNLRPSLTEGNKKRLDDHDEDDDWDFKAAPLAQNGDGHRNFKGWPDSDSSGTKLEFTVAANQEQQRGQGATAKVENHHLGLKKASSELADFFSAGLSGAGNANGQMDLANHFKSPSLPNGFMSFPISGSVEDGDDKRPYSTNEDMTDDEFGEFMDASLEEGSRHQENFTRSEGEVQCLEVSFSSDGAVESGDIYGNDTTDGQISNPRNGITSLGLTNSVNDIISKLYSQSQHVASIDYRKKATENGIGHAIDSSFVTTTQKGFDQNSIWDFKEEATREEKPSVPDSLAPRTLITSTDLQIYIDFYTGLKKELCFLVSRLVDDSEEPHKVVQDVKDFEETPAEESVPRKICCDELLEVLHQPMFQMLESEYNLSKRLQLAEKDRNLAIELLEEARSSIKVLTLGTVDDQYAYVAIWVVIINVCARELRRGACIWKQVIEKHVQSQILSDPRGQRYMQSLGEIYRVAHLVGASANVYKLWILLLSKEDPGSFFSLFDECVALWSSSGLDQALQSLPVLVDAGSSDAIEVLLKSIKHIQEIDVVALFNGGFLQQGTVCHLSLLPLGMLPELKMVPWNEENYFLQVANLWGNLINCDPPRLPPLQVGC